MAARDVVQAVSKVRLGWSFAQHDQHQAQLRTQVATSWKYGVQIRCIRRIGCGHQGVVAEDSESILSIRRQPFEVLGCSTLSSVDHLRGSSRGRRGRLRSGSELCRQRCDRCIALRQLLSQPLIWDDLVWEMNMSVLRGKHSVSTLQVD